MEENISIQQVLQEENRREKLDILISLCKGCADSGSTKGVEELVPFFERLGF